MEPKKEYNNYRKIWLEIQKLKNQLAFIYARRATSYTEEDEIHEKAEKIAKELKMDKNEFWTKYIAN
tara:strand:- start:1034 stop:1234 length:201 start_codon:yes stop_codon:yes gene_type:complete